MVFFCAYEYASRAVVRDVIKLGKFIQNGLVCRISNRCFTHFSAKRKSRVDHPLASGVVGVSPPRAALSSMPAIRVDSPEHRYARSPSLRLRRKEGSCN